MATDLDPLMTFMRACVIGKGLEKSSIHQFNIFERTLKGYKTADEFPFSKKRVPGRTSRHPGRKAGSSTETIFLSSSITSFMYVVLVC